MNLLSQASVFLVRTLHGVRQFNCFVVYVCMSYEGDNTSVLNPFFPDMPLRCGILTRMKGPCLKVNRVSHSFLLRWFRHNLQAIMAKIKLPKNRLSLLIFWIIEDKKILSRLKLSSWSRERKLNLKLAIFQFKRTFALVENTLAFSILTKFDIKFLDNAWGFHPRVT